MEPAAGDRARSSQGGDTQAALVPASETFSRGLPAFPGAEGEGALAVGGRGGTVIAVTNLEDSGPGSLRAAVEAEGPRTVVFRVAGIIELTGALHIRSPYLTVAGQTAPGGGITLRGTGDPLFRLERGVHDVIIRYLRLRVASGDGGDNDNLNIRGGHDIIVDHVSMSWSTDENAGIWRDDDDPPNEAITIQRSILSEGLEVQSNGMDISGEKDYSDRAFPVEAWRKVTRISVHHNLFVHNTHRNPRVTAIRAQVINNVVHNWKYRIGETTSGAQVDYINNYYQAGPMSNVERLLLHEDCSPDHPDWVCPLPDPSIYIAGNVVIPGHPDPGVDNWPLLAFNWSYAPLPTRFRRFRPLFLRRVPVTIQSAYDAYASVVADVGANARLDCWGSWVPNIDSVDARILADVVAGTGPEEPIGSPDEVGGYPVVDRGTRCEDTDGDGMPNLWERLFGLDPMASQDGAEDTDGDGYTNLEEFLNVTNPLG